MPDQPLNRQLLQQVLAAAEARGLGQARLAEQSGLKAETISRAKKRDDIELGTLSRLAATVGLQVVLQPVAATPSSAPRTGTRPAALSDPRFGLSWSNPQADEGVLLRNALVQGRFHAILESAAKDGLPFVRAELERLRSSGIIAEPARHELDEGYEALLPDPPTLTEMSAFFREVADEAHVAAAARVMREMSGGRGPSP